MYMDIDTYICIQAQVNEFMAGKRKILVATDVVARGIDTVNVTSLQKSNNHFRQPSKS